MLWKSTGFIHAVGIRYSVEEATQLGLRATTNDCGQIAPNCGQMATKCWWNFGTKNNRRTTGVFTNRLRKTIQHEFRSVSPPDFRSVSYGMVWYGMVWYGMVWYGMVWYGMVWYGMVWYGMVWYGMVWYGMVWYGMVWYGMVWYGMVWCLFIQHQCTFYIAHH